MQTPSQMQRTRSQDLVPDSNHEILDEDPLLISQSLTYVTDDGSVLHSFQSAPFSYGMFSLHSMTLQLWSASKSFFLRFRFQNSFSYTWVYNDFGYDRWTSLGSSWNSSIRFHCKSSVGCLVLVQLCQKCWGYFWRKPSFLDRKHRDWRSLWKNCFPTKNL